MQIKWTAHARWHLVSLRNFIAAENPRAASEVAARIADAVGPLLEQPSLGRPGRVPGTRELVVSGTPYLVAYTVVGRQTITILAVLHGKQKWPESL
jgi:addiction module RelE/StbE family toxin